MYRSLAALMLCIVAAAAAAQTVKNLQGGSETPSMSIPDVRVGQDPMDRKPDPAAGTPAAKTLPQPAAPAAGDANENCRVRRADTDTGFVVVCEEPD